MDERAVRIAAKLYEARDTARRIFEAEYPGKIRPWMDMVREVATKKGESELSVGQRMAHDLIEAGKSPLMVLAAVVELAEPSPEVGR